MQYINDDLKDF